MIKYKNQKKREEGWYILFPFIYKKIDLYLPFSFKKHGRN